MDAWQIMEYAGVAGGDGVGAYVDRIRGETETEYRDRVLDGRDTVLRGLVDQTTVLEAVTAE